MKVSSPLTLAALSLIVGLAQAAVPDKPAPASPPAAATSTPAAPTAKRRFVFTRDIEQIDSAHTDGSDVKKISTGLHPNLSADGKRVIFEVDADKAEDSHLVVVELATGARTVLTALPKGCWDAVWSPDGQSILVTRRIEKQMVWPLAIAKADGTECHDITPSGEKDTSYYSCTFAADGQSFYTQDLTSIYQLKLDGTVLNKWKIEDIIPHGGMNSGSAMSVSGDGKTLLVDADMDEKNARDDWDGPPPAIWTIDLATQKATRVTPKGFYGWNPAWASADEIFFNLSKTSEDYPSIYRLKLGADVKTKKLVIKVGRDASAAR